MIKKKFNKKVNKKWGHSERKKKRRANPQLKKDTKDIKNE